MPLLKVNNITHEFDYPLLTNASFDLEESSTISINGVSGCGKSTLLHISSTLLKPKDGEVFYNDKSIYSLSKDELLKIRRNEFGIIFQSHYLFKGFSAKENIELSKILVKNDTSILDLTQKLGVNHVLDQKVGELSGGQQQRISIARVLAKKPKIIFADEPTGNLDQKSANDVINILFEYTKKNKAGLILVTHDLSLANKCDIRLKIEDKKLLRV